ncbi:hypothetical protein LJB86_02335 [Deltaproteobacteria bacterium OttesenSCG-928-M10]|nr:hypothetical protein [Deltaproteobacteria bacterium OttesenSCG-928-M10]
MRIGPRKPLEMAQTVLDEKILLPIVKNTQFQREAFSILDRWAELTPEELKKLAEKPTALGIFLLTQQTKEQGVLRSETGEEQLRNGLTPHELLEMNGIDQSIYQYLES